jgi:hypothetical protein
MRNHGLGIHILVASLIECVAHRAHVIHITVNDGGAERDVPAARPNQLCDGLSHARGSRDVYIAGPQRTLSHSKPFVFPCLFKYL